MSSLMIGCFKFLSGWSLDCAEFAQTVIWDYLEAGWDTVLPVLKQNRLGYAAVIFHFGN